MDLYRENRENTAKAVGEAVQFFITTMDSLKLNMVAVDQVGFSPILHLVQPV